MLRISGEMIFIFGLTEICSVDFNSDVAKQTLIFLETPTPICHVYLATEWTGISMNNYCNHSKIKWLGIRTSSFIRISFQY